MRKSVLGAVTLVCGATMIVSCSSSGTKTKNPPTSPSGASSVGSSGGSGGSSASSVASSQLGPQIKAAMTAASTFHLVGVGSDGGKPIGFDIHFDGAKIDGSIKQASGTSKLISPGGPSVYISGDDAYWASTAGAASVATLHGKWLQVQKTDKDFADLAKSYSKAAFLDETIADLAAATDLEPAGSTTLGGVAATRYTEGDSGEVDLAASGPAVILKLIDKSAGGNTLTFSDYGKPYSIAAPPAPQIIDYGKLKSGGH